MSFDAIVVLGANITAKGNLSKVAKSRMDKALELFREGRASRIIVTGKKEALVMKKYAVSKGVSPECILVENLALDTIGNAFFTRKKFLEPRNWLKIVVVTSRFHVPRTRLVFRKVLGKTYRLKFIPSKRVLSPNSLREKLDREKGITLATLLLNSLVADGDAQAIENFLRNIHPAYKRQS